MVVGREGDGVSTLVELDAASLGVVEPLANWPTNDGLNSWKSEDVGSYMGAVEENMRPAIGHAVSTMAVWRVQTPHSGAAGSVASVRLRLVGTSTERRARVKPRTKHWT